MGKCLAGFAFFWAGWCVVSFIWLCDTGSNPILMWGVGVSAIVCFVIGVSGLKRLPVGDTDAGSAD